MFTRRPNFDELAQPNGNPPPELPNVSPAQPTISGNQSRLKEQPVQSPTAAEGLVIIGKGTTVHGTIGDCRKLDIHGVLQGDVVAEMMIVREGGGIKGTVQTDRAEIHGVFEGTLIVHEHLQIESTGDVTGEVSYQTFAMQAGARLSGNIVCNVPAAAASKDAPEATADEHPANVIKTDLWSTSSASSANHE
ncbi:MAG: polymer-forming cytoskeletal protein [Hyphomicrobiaceae bacterium]